jgi:hypothetical protein
VIVVLLAVFGGGYELMGRLTTHPASAALSGPVSAAVGASVRAVPPVANVPTVVQTMTLSPSAFAMTVAYGWLWVLDDQGLQRIDQATGAVTGTLNSAANPQALAAGDGSIWVTSMPSAVIRVDAVTMAVVATISAGNYATAIAAGPRGVWVTDQDNGTVTRINPSTNMVAAVIPTPSRSTWQVADGPDGVWVSGDSAVYRVDPATNRIIATVATGEGVIVDSSLGVWVATGDGSLLRIDPSNDAITSRIAVGSNIYGAAAGGAGLWLLHDIQPSRTQATLSSVDPSSGQLTASIPVNASGTLAVASDAVWIADAYPGRVMRVEMRPGSPVQAVFPTAPSVALVPPLLLAPADGAQWSFYPRRMQLSWQVVGGAKAYSVEVDISDTGSSAYTAMFIDTAVSTTYTFDFGGSNPGRWRVAAIDAAGNIGPYSSWRTFTWTQ